MQVKLSSILSRNFEGEVLCIVYKGLENLIVLSSRSEITQFVSIEGWHSNGILLVPVLLFIHAGQNMQSTPQVPVNSKLDICIQTVSNHARPGAVELKLALDSIHHGLARLSELQRLLACGIHKGVVNAASPEEEVVVHGQRRVCVGREENSSSLEVVKAVREFEIIDVEVKTAQDNTNLGVQKRSVGDALEVLGSNVAAERGVGAADVSDALGLELRLHAGLADDIDLALPLGELENPRDVDGGRVAGSKNVVDLAWDAQVGELLEIFTAGLCRVVCDEDGSLSWYYSSVTDLRKGWFMLSA